MARICGVELKSSDAILAVIEDRDGNAEFIDVEPRRIKIGNDELRADIQSFYDSFVDFVRVNGIDVVVVKKRAKKGQMAGGAVSFKLEALIQLNGTVDVEFVSSQGIAAANKRGLFDIPAGLNKYQEGAFMAASLYRRQN
ncbi:MAG: DUF3010 family protein [Candidatus Latescibacteria bacterium]|nr:DUF3010 family protein [Candidatus Latescibacterota bacterium]